MKRKELISSRKMWRITMQAGNKSKDDEAFQEGRLTLLKLNRDI